MRCVRKLARWRSVACWALVLGWAGTAAAQDLPPQPAPPQPLPPQPTPPGEDDPPPEPAPTDPEPSPAPAPRPTTPAPSPQPGAQGTPWPTPQPGAQPWPNQGPPRGPWPGYPPANDGWGNPYGRWGYEAPLPRRLDYNEGEPAPVGYHFDREIRRPYVIAGATTFGALWLISAAVGAAVQQDNDGDGLSPLFVPVVGPFIATGTGDASSFGTFLLVIDGLGQALGVGMFIFGIADPKPVWIRDGLSLDVTPLLVNDELVGAGIRGRF